MSVRKLSRGVDETNMTAELEDYCGSDPRVKHPSLQSVCDVLSSVSVKMFSSRDSRHRPPGAHR